MLSADMLHISLGTCWLLAPLPLLLINSADVTAMCSRCLTDVARAGTMTHCQACWLQDRGPPCCRLPCCIRCSMHSPHMLVRALTAPLSWSSAGGCVPQEMRGRATAGSQQMADDSCSVAVLSWQKQSRSLGCRAPACCAALLMVLSAWQQAWRAASHSTCDKNINRLEAAVMSGHTHK